jgi:hypothetical protein
LSLALSNVPIANLLVLGGAQPRRVGAFDGFSTRLAS